MNKLKNIFKDRKGNMSLWAVIMVLILCLVFAGVFEFMRIFTVASTVKTTIQRDLESTAMQTARDSYQSVKQYSFFSPYVNQPNFQAKICSDLGLAKQDNMLYCVSDNVAKFYIINPVLTYSVTTLLNFTYTFSLQIPVYYFGKQVGTSNIPITLNATYQFK
jgi:Flp pilus assembly protein TadG